MKNQQNPRFSVQPMQGQKLPDNWQQQAKMRAALAETHYQWELENAWRGQDAQNSGNIMRDSRLKPIQWKDILGEQ